jgi:hypothetical protein
MPYIYVLDCRGKDIETWTGKGVGIDTGQPPNKSLTSNVNRHRLEELAKGVD